MASAAPTPTNLLATTSTNHGLRPALIKIKHLSTVRLDRSNYFTWKSQTLAHLRGYELLQFVEGPVTVANPNLIQQDQLLLAWLFLSISASVLPQLAGHKTSFDVWVALGEIFNTRSKAWILHLKNQIQTFRKNSLSANDYVARLTTMAEELPEAGVAIDDGELSLITLNGLDASYDPFVTAQTARMEDINFSSFLGLLRAYESRLQRPIDDRIATANVTQSDTSNNVLVCQICNKRGHSAIACFNRHNEQRFPTQHNKNRNRNRGVKVPNNGSSNTNAVWYPDSGASNHVTSDLTNLQLSDSNPGARSVTVANGSDDKCTGCCGKS